MWHRTPSVAGTFYPADEKKLRQQLEKLAPPQENPMRVVSVVAPHAGYIYSGKFAGLAYSKIQIPDVVVILCPNHTGQGKRVSVWDHGEWGSPLGTVPVEEELAKSFLENCALAESDRAAHLKEHAAEVHLPFLQKYNSQVRILPIVLGPIFVEDCLEVGVALATALKAFGHETLIVASTDMSHYIPAQEAKKLDALALEKLSQFDPEGLYRLVVEKDISMCGFIPTTVAMEAARHLGAKKAEVICYGHSGETTGDDRSVVAYAAALLY